eukprot:5583297-Alexandrium_andersonii.AAC.1
MGETASKSSPRLKCMWQSAAQAQLRTAANAWQGGEVAVNSQGVPTVTGHAGPLDARPDAASKLGQCA